MSKIFSKLKNLEAGKSQIVEKNPIVEQTPIIEKVPIAEKVPIVEKIVPIKAQPEVKSFPEKNKFYLFTAGMVMVTCIVLIAVSFQALRVLQAIENKNAIVFSRFDAKFEQEKKQVVLLKEKINAVYKEFKVKIENSDQDSKAKLNNLQDVLNFKLSQMKLDLARARIVADKLVAKNKIIEAQLLELNTKTEQAKTAVVQ